MVSVDQIREVASKFVANSLSADDFLDAFSALSHDVHQGGDRRALKLADSIEALLADVRAGFISVKDLTDLLADVLKPSPVAYYYVAGAGFGSNVVMMSQFDSRVNRPVVVEKGFPAASSGTSPGVVFGSARLVQA